MTLWLLATCGLPFSGKTTLSRQVEARLGILRVSVDDYLDSRAPDVEVGDDEWLNAYVTAYRQIETLLQAGKSVIFDSVGHTRRDRYRLHRLAGRSGARYLIVRIEFDRADALARLNANRIEPLRPNVPLPSFERVDAEFEEPERDEPVIPYRPFDDLDTWIDTTLQTVLSTERMN